MLSIMNAQLLLDVLEWLDTSILQGHPQEV